MTHTEQLLCCIHRAAEMGRENVGKLQNCATDDHFRALLARWQQDYSRYYSSADVLLKARGGDDSGLGAMSRVMGGLMTDLNLAVDGSDAHIAEMLHRGTEQGIRELGEQLDAARGIAEEEAINLGQNLYDFLLRCRSDLLRYMKPQD